MVAGSAPILDAPLPPDEAAPPPCPEGVARAYVPARVGGELIERPRRHEVERDDAGPQSWQFAAWDLERQAWDHRAVDSESYSRRGGLEDRLAEMDAEFTATRAETTRRIQRLRHELPVVIAAYITEGLDVAKVEWLMKRDKAVDTEEAFWPVVLRALAESCIVTAYNLDGTPPEERLPIAKVRRERPTRFSSVGEVLRFYQQVREIGRGPVSLEIAEDTDETRRERARARGRGRALPRLADGGRAKGYLPMEYMPAKQSRSGSSPGSRNEDDKLLEEDIRVAIARAKISPTDLQALRDSDVGIYRGPAHKTQHGHMVEAYSRASGAELARWFRLAEGVDLSPQAAGKRVGRARGRLHNELARRGLMPPPKKRHAVAEGAPEAHGGAAKPHAVSFAPTWGEAA